MSLYREWKHDLINIAEVFHQVSNYLQQKNPRKDTGYLSNNGGDIFSQLHNICSRKNFVEYLKNNFVKIKDTNEQQMAAEINLAMK